MVSCFARIFLFFTSHDYGFCEIDVDIAPLWDPSQRKFVAMMTMHDYVRALSICLERDIPMIELSGKSIADMLSSPLMKFQHSIFDALDAEASSLLLVHQLFRSSADFVPIVNTEDGNIVSILGYLDIIHLLNEAAKIHSHLFMEKVSDIKKAFYINTVTVKRSTSLLDAIRVIESNKISGVPVIDDFNGTVCSYFHKSEVSFVTRASDADNILLNLRNMCVGDILNLRSQIGASGEPLPVTSQSLLTAQMSDSITTVLEGMMRHRVTKVVLVDPNDMICLGVLSIKDIVKFYLTF